ncbi:MAG: ketoacyl-ACP synthase III [Microscillaceae bacterium]|nr:ketoacyl-ACP synthase III [Microscillaceae bacterium]MDW8461342.1 ketoacyl-ACP synthase III [Cytophagales bacterium]
MYISQIATYLPNQVVTNEYFQQINGLSHEWIIERTGIEQRRKAQATENTNSMAIQAVKALSPFAINLQNIDLIVGATYTPYDTIHSLAHAVQHYLDLHHIPVLSISTACSSFVNAMEIVQGYFAMGKASQALVVVADNNTAYSNEKDTIGGHLWGDGAAALIVTKNPDNQSTMRVIDIITAGAGNVGKAPEGVYLRPNDGKFQMPHGKDVFMNACQYMTKATIDVLQRNGYQLSDLDYLVPHQANLRITKNVAQRLGLPEEKALSNIQYLGNTGCAGCVIALQENLYRFQKNDLIVVTVFGGGYSYGAMLVEYL